MHDEAGRYGGMLCRGEQQTYILNGCLHRQKADT
jgi:hypothetical protein